MLSFLLLVLSSTVCFLSSFPDSLPQPFLRCLLLAFAFHIFRFPSAFFRPLPFHFRLLSSLFLPFLFFLFPPHIASSVLVFRFRFLRFPRSSLPDFSCILSRFLYSAFLMVSFRSSLLRSRSCSTGDSLLDFSSGIDTYLPIPFVLFRFSTLLLSLCFFLSFSS